MKKRIIWMSLLAGMTYTANIFGQTYSPIAEQATSYEVTGFGSAATGDRTPFWQVSNQQAKVPLESGNGYLSGALYHRQAWSNGWHWGAGMEVIVAAPRDREVYLQQLYAEVGYRCLQLSIGSKARRNDFVDARLSTGDMAYSGNASPIPEVNISIPHFTVVPWTKGWLQLKGDFAVGRSFDKHTLERFAGERETYIYNVLWHHKSLAVQIKDTRHGFPLAAQIGVNHWAQWGGTSNNPKIGTQPHSFKDFIRVVCGKSGDSQATISDQVNVLGAHYGTYDFKLSYLHSDWQFSTYYQHYFNDLSGMVFENNLDGLWGGELSLKHISWLKKVAIEYMTTRNQSGPFHFIWFDHEKHPGVGGGGDDYYNNGEYRTGFSYANRAIGSPLILSPAYNANGVVSFRHTRIQDWHFAAEGALSNQVSYRVMFTKMNSWGTPNRPLIAKQGGTSSLIEIDYQHPRLAGWQFCGSVGLDTGTLLGDHVGFSLSVSKRGILKRW